MTGDLIAHTPTFQMWITLVLVVCAVVLYVTEWVSLELTSLGLIACILVLFHIFPQDLLDGSGDLDSQRLLAGFANPALITVLALLVVGEALVRTGALDSVAAMAAHPRLGRIMGLVLILALVLGLSAFLNNTPVVVIFLPIVQGLARQLKLSGSRVMMPLSYVAILGGMTTLIGSSTNLLVSNSLVGMGRPALTFFEFSAIGSVMAAVGFVYVTFLLPRLLPDRSSLTGALTRHGQQFISQIVIPDDSSLIGQHAVAGHFKDLPDVTVRMIQRGEHAELPPFDDFALQAGDILVLAAPRVALAEVAARHPGHLHPPTQGEDSGDLSDARLRQRHADAQSEDPLLVAEAMVTPSSRMVGLSLEQYGFHRRFRCVTVGVLRRARMIRARMTDIRLEAGDVILVQGRRQDLDALSNERDVVLISGTADPVPQRDKALMAGGIFAIAVGLAATGLVPIVIASVVAATLLIAFGALNLRQAARAMDRKIMLVVAASLALGEALYHTGGALWIAGQLLGVLDGATPVMLLSGFFLMVAVFTNVLSNNACAVLFTPIGIGVALKAGIDPRLFAITVVLAANCSFASPVGYKTNLLVMGPGQYTFADFVKAGAPLLVIMWLVFTLIAPMFWVL